MIYYYCIIDVILISLNLMVWPLKCSQLYGYNFRPDLFFPPPNKYCTTVQGARGGVYDIVIVCHTYMPIIGR